MQSDEDIIRRCIKKDRKAQKILYERYADIFLGICNRYTANIAEAEDILQEGFVKVFFHLQEFSGTGSFFNWMRRIMINTAITYYHKNLKYRYYDEIESMYDSPHTDAPDKYDFTREELLMVIQSLPSGYRMIFNLYAIEGYKHKEIAEMLEIDVNTSKSQYSRAKKMIRRKLDAMSRIAIRDNKKDEEE
ncbi:MAG: RNA polymerase sigma factor [Bacteroidales bacterium]|nr:RNA polymerase sigma factor [Bacteroidales bacterium]